MPRRGRERVGEAAYFSGGDYLIFVIGRSFRSNRENVRRFDWNESPQLFTLQFAASIQ
jgi:hypothetical protein